MPHGNRTDSSSLASTATPMTPIQHALGGEPQNTPQMSSNGPYTSGSLGLAISGHNHGEERGVSASPARDAFPVFPGNRGGLNPVPTVNRKIKSGKPALSSDMGRAPSGKASSGPFVNFGKHGVGNNIVLTEIC
jgi:hypothetical protein